MHACMPPMFFFFIFLQIHYSDFYTVLLAALHCCRLVCLQTLADVFSYCFITPTLLGIGFFSFLVLYPPGTVK